MMYRGMLGMLGGIRIHSTSLIPQYTNTVVRRPPNLFEQMEDYPWSMTAKDWFGNEEIGWATFDIVEQECITRIGDIFYCHPLTYRRLIAAVKVNG
jgi:hypothetical protein